MKRLIDADRLLKELKDAFKEAVDMDEAMDIALTTIEEQPEARQEIKLEKRYPNVSDEDFSRIFQDAYLKGRRDGVESVKRAFKEMALTLARIYLDMEEADD